MGFKQSSEIEEALIWERRRERILLVGGWQEKRLELGVGGEQKWQSVEGACLLQEAVGRWLQGLCGQRTRGREPCCRLSVGRRSVV